MPKKLLSFKLTGDYYEITKNSIIPNLNSNLGNLNLDLKNHHNKSILSLAYVPSDFAKQNGMKPKTCKYTIKFKNVTDKGKKSLRKFFNTLPNTQNENGSFVKNLFSFFPSALEVLGIQMTNYLIVKSIGSYYLRIQLNTPSYSTAVSTNSGSSNSVPTWEVGTIASVITGVFVATIQLLWKPIMSELDFIATELAKSDYAEKLKPLLESAVRDSEVEAAQRASEFEAYADAKFGIDYNWNTEQITELFEDAEFHEATPNKGPLKVDPFKDII